MARARKKSEILELSEGIKAFLEIMESRDEILNKEIKVSHKAIIRGIEIGGFKSVRSPFLMEIANLTILAGRNSSGKSSFFQPLLLLKQTLEHPRDPGPLLLNGANVSFENANDFLGEESNSFFVKLYTDIGLEPAFMEWNFEGASFGIDLTEQKMVLHDKTVTYSLEALQDFKINIFEKLGDKIKGFDFEISNKRFISEIILVDEGRQIGGFPSYYADKMQKLITSVWHLQGLRKKAERSYEALGRNLSEYPGLFDGYVATIILRWQQEDEFNKILKLHEYIKLLGIAHNLEANRLSDSKIQLLVAISEGSRLVDISDVGVGVSQTLPILVAIIEAGPENLIYVEQPEIHLHPNAQYKLGEILADALQNGKRLVIETHSSILMLGIQTAIAKGKMNYKDVIFHWFEQDKNNRSQITSIKPNKFGALKSWPSDFDQVYMRANIEYLNTVDDLRAAGKKK